MRRRLLTIVGLVCVILGFAPAAQAHHYSGVHWRHHQEGQLHVFLEDHASPRWTAPMKYAAQQWSRSGYVAMSVVAKCPTTAEVCIPVYSYSKRDNRLGHANKAFWPCDWTPKPPYPGRCHIVWANVKLNNYYDRGDALDRNVVTHEVGHTLGLGHSRYSGSVMHCCSRDQTPDAHDFATLRVYYRHHHAS